MLLEPIMQLEIVAPEEYSPSINADLARRRAEIQQIDMRGNNKASINSLLLTPNKMYNCLNYAHIKISVLHFIGDQNSCAIIRIIGIFNSIENYHVG